MTSMRVVRWWDSLPRATRVVVVVLPVLMAALAAWAFNEVIGQDHHQFDLRLYYDAINFWTSGHDLYSYSQPDPVNIELGFTYPPVGALLMTPMALLPYPAVLLLSIVGIVAAGAAFVYLVLRERVRLPKPLMLAAVGVVTAFAFTLEPFRQTLAFGQINIYLVLLVALDLLVLGRRGSKWAGVGIGLATAIKLTPGIFIIYLLVVGRWRAALTAIGTVIGANLVSLVIAPAETWKYFTALMWETSRVGFLDTTMNQSINGLLARIDSPLAPARLPWLILAALVVVVGFWRARRAAVAGDELAAMTLAGLVGVLVSPVSWVHHIIWIFPTMLILAMQLRRTIGELAADTSGYRSTDRALLGRIGRVVGYSMLMTTGLLVWCIPTASLMDVKDWEYERGGAVLAVAGSVQLLWMLIALVVLPLEQATGRRPDGSGRTPWAALEPAAGSAPATTTASMTSGLTSPTMTSPTMTTVDTGSVPAAARASRVILPATRVGQEPRS